MSWKQWWSLLILYIVYLLFGGFIFLLIESPEEDARVSESKDLKHAIYETLIKCEGNSTDQNLSEREEAWTQIAEQINQPSLVHNSSDLPSKKWTFYNSFFVAVTVASTIGYGHLAPSSAAGRIFCIAFALIGIPLNGILFSSLGDFFNNKFFRKSRKRAAKHSVFFVMAVDVSLLITPGLFIFLAAPAGVFTVIEGWNYLDSFYYAFVTLTTVGFGDLVAGQNDIGPWNWAYRSFIILWIIFGLGYLVMIINIITKGFRSKPIVSMNKKVSARIRATRKTLAKDAIALRELVNQIKIVKVKPIPKPDQLGECRHSACNQPSGEEPDSHKKHASIECESRLTRFHSDHSIYCNSKEKFNPPALCCKIKEGSEDPVQLLTRLAAALCDENEEDNEDESSKIEEIDNQNINEQNNDNLFVSETILQRINRSLRFSSRAPTVRVQQSSSTPSSPKLGAAFGSVGRKFAIKNRLRLKGELSDPEYKPTFRSQQQLMLEDETGKPSTRSSKRSLSESNSLEQTAATVSSDNFSSDVTNPKEETRIDADCSCTATNQNALSVPTIVEFCDILDRVGRSHVSRRNSAELP